MGFRGVVGLGLLGLGMNACVLDLDRFGSSGGGGEGGADLEACGDTAVCIAPPPLGWSGPVALVEVGMAGCGGDFPNEVFRGDVILDVPDLSCSCSCGAPTGQSCGKPTFHNYLSDDCSPVNNGSDLTAGQCHGSFSPSPPAGGSVRVDGGVATGGACAAMPVEVRPEILTERRLACGIEASPSNSCLEGEACVPVPSGTFEPRLCIWAEGELPCPTGAGFAPAGTVFRNGYQDDRECSACTCGAPSDGTCEGSSSVYAAGSCSGSAKATMPHDGTCVPLSPTGFASVRIQASTVVPGSCIPADVIPEGELVRRDPVTVCCTPSL